MQRQDRTRQHQPCSVPWPLDGEPDVVAVDTTWGILQRLHAAPDVPSVGELELLEMVNEGAVLIDCRTAGSYGGQTIPGSVRIPHDEIVNRQVADANFRWFYSPGEPRSYTSRSVSEAYFGSSSSHTARNVCPTVMRSRVSR